MRVPEYSCLAPYYDLFNDPEEIAQKKTFCRTALERFASKPLGSTLDLACGTGDTSIFLHDLGADVVGVDLSEPMLALAKSKAENRKILFLRQNMTSLDLFGTVGLAVCLSDSLNCLSSTADIDGTFGRVSLFLEEDGLFLFDVSTPFRLKNVLDGKDFVMEEGPALLTLSNVCNPKTGVLKMRFDLFLREADGRYRRESEVQKTRAYRLSVWKRLLIINGFSLVGVFSSSDFAPIEKDCEKWYFVARKKASASLPAPRSDAPA